MSNYYKINQYDTANGEGLRVSIFFCGCNHHCKNCFNQELWSFDVGKKFGEWTYEHLIKPTINEHIAGISILGGEPLDPRNVQSTYELCRWFKRDFSDKNIWIWTGYTLEELVHFKSYTNEYQTNALRYTLPLIDVLIDGKFIEEQKDLTLKWRGSRNQRVIDVKKTIEQKEIVLYCD